MPEKITACCNLYDMFIKNMKDDPQACEHVIKFEETLVYATEYLKLNRAITIKVAHRYFVEFERMLKTRSNHLNSDDKDRLIRSARNHFLFLIEQFGSTRIEVLAIRWITLKQMLKSDEISIYFND